MPFKLKKGRTRTTVTKNGKKVASVPRGTGKHAVRALKVADKRKARAKK